MEPPKPGAADTAVTAPLFTVSAAAPWNISDTPTPCQQGLTLVHFSAQPEPFLTLKPSPQRLITPSIPRHQHPLNTPRHTKSAYVELNGGRVYAPACQYLLSTAAAARCAADGAGGSASTPSAATPLRGAGCA